MGILDFFKRFSNKSEQVVIEIKFDNIDQWICSRSNKVLEQRDFAYILEQINLQKEKMQKNIRLLNNAELENPNIPKRHRDIKDANRASYVRRVNQLLEDITIPERGEEILDFCRSFDSLLNTFSKDSERNYMILQEFFAVITSNISKNLRQLNTLIKKIQLLCERAGMSNLYILREKIEKIRKEERIKKDLIEKIKLLKKQEQEQSKELKERKNIIQQYIESNDYKEYHELKNKEGILEKKNKNLENNWYHFFGVIQSALKKYERLILDNKLIKSYSTNPWLTLLQDSDLKILQIIKDLKTTINDGKIELKEKKKEKILQDLERMSEEKIKELLHMCNETNAQLDECQSEIIQIDIMNKIQELKRELSNKEFRLLKTKTTIDDMTKKLQRTPHKEELFDDLEKSIRENIDEEVNIV